MRVRSPLQRRDRAGLPTQRWVTGLPYSDGATGSVRLCVWSVSFYGSVIGSCLDHLSGHGVSVMRMIRDRPRSVDVDE